MCAVDEEAPGLDRRQTGQGHGQPVGVGQLLDQKGQTVATGQQRLQPLDLIVAGREGVDAPEAGVLVLFQNRIGDALQHRIGIDRDGGGFSGGAQTARDNLNCGLGHFSNAAIMTNRNTRLHAFARRLKPRGRGVHGQVTV